MDACKHKQGGLSLSLSGSHPDITVMVDWALTINDLSLSLWLTRSAVRTNLAQHSILAVSLFHLQHITIQVLCKRFVSRLLLYAVTR